MTLPLKIEGHIQFKACAKGRKVITPDTPVALPAGRIPRVARLMALAIRFEGLIRDGQITDYAELARLGHVTPARITQIMNLGLLAADVQEELLFLPPIVAGRDPIHLRQLQPIAATPDWRKQRRMWQALVKSQAE